MVEEKKHRILKRTQVRNKMQTHNEIFAKLKQYAKDVDNFLKSQLQGKVKEIWDAANHYILAGGKRLRPFIVLQSYSLKKEDSQRIIPIASAVEILHTFTLIHDDIMDKDATRRNVPSVHTKWGESVAILAGDLLFSMVFVLLQKAKVPLAVQATISGELGKVCMLLCEGQTMDVAFETQTEVSVEEYMEMIRLKTGALFRTSAMLGGLAAECSTEEIEHLQTYGEKLGVAFQIQDDILGIEADQKKLGKPIGSDLRAGKKTFLVLYTQEHLDSADVKEFNRILTKPDKTEEDVLSGIELIRKSGAIKKATELATEYSNEAIEALKIFANSEARADLEEIAQVAVERNH